MVQIMQSKLATRRAVATSKQFLGTFRKHPQALSIPHRTGKVQLYQLRSTVPNFVVELEVAIVCGGTIGMHQHATVVAIDNYIVLVQASSC